MGLVYRQLVRKTKTKTIGLNRPEFGGTATICGNMSRCPALPHFHPAFRLSPLTVFTRVVCANEKKGGVASTYAIERLLTSGLVTHSNHSSMRPTVRLRNRHSPGYSWAWHALFTAATVRLRVDQLHTATRILAGRTFPMVPLFNGRRRGDDVNTIPVMSLFRTNCPAFFPNIFPITNCMWLRRMQDPSTLNGKCAMRFSILPYRPAGCTDTSPLF